MIKYKALRQFRLDKGWTQGQAAREIGIQQSYLSKLENDQALASMEILDKISATYDCEISDIALVKDSKTYSTQPIGRMFYASLLSALAGILLIALAYFGIIQNNTAYTYQLSQTQPNKQHTQIVMPNFVITDEFMGEKYRESVQGTQATYILLGERPISPLTNRVLYFFGVFLVLVGLALQTVRLVKSKKRS